jgi:hypothetical protein
MTKKRAICTIFTDSHIAQAITLWESLRPYLDSWDFIAVRIPGAGYELPASVPRKFLDCCIRDSDLPTCKVGPRFWYDAFEYCNYLRGPLHNYLCEKQGTHEWWYVDADCWFVESPDRLGSGWRDGSVMLCPHRRKPTAAAREEIPLLFYGAYNSGLLGLRHGPEARGFCSWFSDRLEWASFSEPNLGLFVDQRWLDLAPSYFACSTIQDPGINVGYWNFSAEHTSGSISLGLLHFSQIDLHSSTAELKTQATLAPAEKMAFLRLAEKYRERVAYWNEQCRFQANYPYSHVRDGTPITKTLRRNYYCAVCSGNPVQDPFSSRDLHSDISESSAREQFVNQILPYAGLLASRLFVHVSSLNDLGRNFSPEELMNRIPAKVALKNIFNRSLRKLKLVT